MQRAVATAKLFIEHVNDVNKRLNFLLLLSDNAFIRDEICFQDEIAIKRSLSVDAVTRPVAHYAYYYI